MKDSWEARFVSKQIDGAWLELRMHLADRLAEAVASGGMLPAPISTETGRTLTVSVEDAHVVVVAGDAVHTSANVDEASYRVFEILHDRWQVVHPAFLDSDLIEKPAAPMAQGDHADRASTQKDDLPAVGTPQSREQLQEWVEATFQRQFSGSLKVAPGGEVCWRTKRGAVITVKVRNQARIEIFAPIAEHVIFAKAHDVMGELSRKYFALKFFLVQDTLMVSQSLPANPFVPEQLTSAMRSFTACVDSFAWVADRVLRKRARLDRAAAAEAMQSRAAAEAALADAVRERAVAEAALARIQRVLERTRQQRSFRPRPHDGDAA